MRSAKSRNITLPAITEKDRLPTFICQIYFEARLLRHYVYLDITTLHKEVEKSVGKVGGEGANHPRVEESYVGDLEADGGVVKICNLVLR